MSSQLHLRIRWPDGAILPIMTVSDATGDDIYKMLRFSAGPKQELRLFFNDLPIDKDIPLKTYGIQDGDTVQAHVYTIVKDNSRMIKSLEAIAREAAKLNDIRIEQIETTQNSCQPPIEYPDSFDSLLYVPNSSKTILPEPPTEIPNEPLPIFWSPSEANQNFPESDENVQTSILPKYSTLEEASQFFASYGWHKWMW